MLTTSSLDFGYPWWLSYGHLVGLLPAVAGLVIGRIRKWPLWSMIAFGLVAVWAGAAFYVVRSLDLNHAPKLITEKFLRSGVGRVLDIGAGTGRSSIMVLAARPQATLVATDLFADSFQGHFGAHGRPQDRLLNNLKAAGVDQRASIETADMRKLPFENASFDAIVSAYAIDHVGREGAKQALAEAIRVVKPGGEFLMILIENDRWTKFAFGPLLSHGGTRGASWWRQQATEAGFQTVEEGTAPATLYFLLRRP
jgi:ubiquinone/menaquinone biosynthesis C-methylase UbiE